MRQIEEKITNENNEEITSSAKYKRSRQILQIMQE